MPLQVLPEATGLRLYKHVKDHLIGCQLIMFTGGAAAVDTVLRRAAISGYVKVLANDEIIPDYFADVYSDTQTCIQSVALDRKSYMALKNRWMRCKIEH